MIFRPTLPLLVCTLCTLCTLGACTPSPRPALQPQVNYGPAAGVKPSRVLSLQATCGSLEARCPDEYRASVDAIVRSGLEFAGYAVVDSETLRLATRERREEHTDDHTTTTSATVRHSSTEIIRPLIILDKTVTSDSTSVSTTETDRNVKFVVLTGSNFEDLSVDERHQVIEKAGTDAVTSTRIVVGGKMGIWAPNQNVEVMVKLGVDRGDQLAWASRCTASSNDFDTVTAALEQAARCAMHGATAR